MKTLVEKVQSKVAYIPNLNDKNSKATDKRQLVQCPQVSRESNRSFLFEYQMLRSKENKVETEGR